tara:strand:- start:234 stop:518 length:285 start_codon:yes stop_codon:yes gene_type:complete
MKIKQLDDKEFKAIQKARKFVLLFTFLTFLFLFILVPIEVIFEEITLRKWKWVILFLFCILGYWLSYTRQTLSILSALPFVILLGQVWQFTIYN